MAYMENGIYDQTLAHLEQKNELSGLQTSGELTLPTMATTKTTVNKQTQRQNPQQQRTISRFWKNQDMWIKKVGDELAEGSNNQVKNKIPKNQMQKHTHPFRSANCQKTN